jgi:hypothetical protein
MKQDELHFIRKVARVIGSCATAQHVLVAQRYYELAMASKKFNYAARWALDLLMTATRRRILGT